MAACVREVVCVCGGGVGRCDRKRERERAVSVYTVFIRKVAALCVL